MKSEPEKEKMRSHSASRHEDGNCMKLLPKVKTKLERLEDEGYHFEGKIRIQ